MPRLGTNDLLSSLLFGAATILVLALACGYVASHGGPEWLSGQELAVFAKLALATLAFVVIDICWKANPRDAH